MAAHRLPMATYPDGLDAAIIAALPALLDRRRLLGAFINALRFQPEFSAFSGVTAEQVEAALSDLHAQGQFDPDAYIQQVRSPRGEQPRHRKGVKGLVATAR